MAAEYFLPLYLQAVKGSSPLRSGVLILPLLVVAAIVGVLAGIGMNRLGHFTLIVRSGAVLLTTGAGLLVLLKDTSSVKMITGLQAVCGAGAGLLLEAPLIALQAHTEPDDVATANGTFGFLREMGAAVSLMVGGVVFQSSVSNSAKSLNTKHIEDRMIVKFLGANAEANAPQVKIIADVHSRVAVERVYASALSNVWALYTAVAGLGVLAAALVSTKKLSSEHVEIRTGLHRNEVEESSTAQQSR